MEHAHENFADWGEELAEFLRKQPGVGAVRIQPASRKIEVATIGDVDLGKLQVKLDETISSILAQLSQDGKTAVPLGFNMRQKDGQTQISRDTCVTA